MLQVRIVLQARMSSTRLPAKCLLPIGGMPLVLLSALRAMNTGIPLYLATSTECEDNAIMELAEENGIFCHRGPLNDVYTRFLGAISDLSDDSWIVRLTGDNCFPDGDFIEALIDQAERSNLNYLGTSSPLDRLPYGLSAEVFRAGALRSVEAELTEFDREHVTPAIKRKFGAKVSDGSQIDFSHLRCTVDTAVDYFRIRNLFSSFREPVTVPWRVLCDGLQNEPGSASSRIPWKIHPQGIVGSVTLGTAQLGIKQYGRTNQGGIPEDREVAEILDFAVKNGVTHFDTARTYGTAEERLGQNIRTLYAQPIIVTKLDPLTWLGKNATAEEIEAGVKGSVIESIHNLRNESLSVLMLHRWRHRRSHKGIVWEVLCRLHREHVISRIGASVYTPEEAMDALRDPLITHLQIPCNLVDYRWHSAEFLAERKRRPDVLVYARSAFLQGVLISDAECWPRRGNFNPQSIVTQLDRLVEEFGRRSRADLCLAYLRACSWIDTIVVGVETVAQLRQNLSNIREAPLSEEQVCQIREKISSPPEWLLDPSQWN